MTFLLNFAATLSAYSKEYSTVSVGMLLLKVSYDLHTKQQQIKCIWEYNTYIHMYKEANSPHMLRQHYSHSKIND